MRKPTETRLIHILSYIFKTSGDGKSFVDGLTAILSGVVTRAVNHGKDSTNAEQFSKLLCGQIFFNVEYNFCICSHWFEILIDIHFGESH